MSLFNYEGTCPIWASLRLIGGGSDLQSKMPAASSGRLSHGIPLFDGIHHINNDKLHIIPHMVYATLCILNYIVYTMVFRVRKRCIIL
jgi:hypothetical protein